MPASIRDLLPSRWTFFLYTLVIGTLWIYLLPGFWGTYLP